MGRNYPVAKVGAPSDQPCQCGLNNIHEGISLSTQRTSNASFPQVEVLKQFLEDTLHINLLMCLTGGTYEEKIHTQGARQESEDHGFELVETLLLVAALL